MEKHNELSCFNKFEFSQGNHAIIDSNNEKQEAIGKDKLLEWLLFIDNPENEFTKMAETKNEAIGRARDMLKALSQDERLQEKYLAREKAIRDKYSALSEALDRGREERIEEGKLLKALKISKRMIKDGMPLDVISKYTELTIKELEQLVKEIESS